MSFFRTMKREKLPDPESFHSFYVETLPILSRQLQRLGLRKREELEDVLQNSYLEAHRSFASIKDPNARLSWLLTIGRRQFYLHLGQKLRWKKIFEEEGGAWLSTSEGIADASLRPIDDHLHDEALCKIVLNELEGIEDPNRSEAIRLYLIEDRSLREVSESLNLNLSTLTTWISRFRQKLQIKLAESEKATETQENLILKAKEFCS